MRALQSASGRPVCCRGGRPQAAPSCYAAMQNGTLGRPPPAFLQQPSSRTAGEAAAAAPGSRFQSRRQRRRRGIACPATTDPPPPPGEDDGGGSFDIDALARQLGQAADSMRLEVSCTVAKACICRAWCSRPAEMDGRRCMRASNTTTHEGRQHCPAFCSIGDWAWRDCTLGQMPSAAVMSFP